MTMCFIHNRFYAAGKCPLCVKEEKELAQLDLEIRMLEAENKQEIVLWSGK